ncbi:MAG: PspA/IM30 family protein [Acidimicrobiales bacterium]
MGVMKRLTGIVQAKANKVMDRVEDPRETLDLSYEKQLEQLQQVRRGVADVATARKRIELQAQQLQQTASKLQDQARQALGQQREDLAREALSRRAGIATQLDGLKTQHEQLVQQEQRLIATNQTLQARVESFRTQKETLKASYSAAQAQTKIGEAVSGISESMSDTGLAMQRAQDKIAQMQARAGAVDELLASGALTDMTGSSDPLQAELDKASASGQVDMELAQLKGELAPPPSAQLPSAGTTGAAAPPGTGESSGGEDEEPDDGEVVDADAGAVQPAPAGQPASPTGDVAGPVETGAATVPPATAPGEEGGSSDIFSLGGAS